MIGPEKNDFIATRKKTENYRGRIRLVGVPCYDLLYRSTHQFKEALTLKQNKLTRYRQKVLEQKAVKRELLSLQTTFKKAETLLLKGKTPPLAAAELQEIISKITNSPSCCINLTAQPDCCGSPNWRSDHVQDAEGLEEAQI